MLKDRIKELRLERGWSQDTLAKKMGYKDRTSVNKLETGKMNIGYDKISKLCIAFNVTPTELGIEDDTEKITFEIDFSNIYNQLTEKNKLMLLEYANYLNDNQDK